ncbi:MAG: winged helix DNA-binding domain-containing protein [Kofleriaceae bacterium]|nr:winged helix DNA-binding domain-containing protein [Kofleriaceae bacterium]
MVPSPALRVDVARARAHWHARAGLAAPLPGDADEVIARTGWLRTLGGVDVYLAARARVPGLGRATLDALVDAGRLRVIPAVRGCVYLVPAAHVPLALAVADDAWRKRTDRDVAKAGTSWREIEEVGRAVMRVLGAGAATTDAIRRALPDGAVRGLGEAGKRAGVTSPLPLALRDLELRGAIARASATGRLDTERYVWRLVPAAAPVAVPGDAVDRWAALVRIFVGHAGPATVGDVATWTGLARRDATAAIARAALVPVAVEGLAEPAWIVEDDVTALAEPAPPSTRVTLLSFEDGYLVHHGGPRWMVAPAQWDRPVRVWGNTRGATLGDAAHPATRTVCVGGVVVGIWEMDPDAGSVLWATWTPVAPPVRAAIDQLATETGYFLEDELGHARSFSLDTDAEVRGRAAEVARLASGGGDVVAPRRPRPTVAATRTAARTAPRTPAKKAARTPAEEAKKAARTPAKKAARR